MGKITVKPIFKQVKIILDGKTSSWESVSQSGVLREAAARMELTFASGMQANKGSSFRCVWRCGLR